MHVNIIVNIYEMFARKVEVNNNTQMVLSYDHIQLVNNCQ